MLSGARISDVEAGRVEAVVIGASVGGIDALGVLLPALPTHTPFPVIVVIHMPPRGRSTVVEVFERLCSIAVREATDKEAISAATAWFAPPDYHLLVESDRRFALSIDPPDTYSRPSIDALFESAAEAYQSSLLGIILTGASADGAVGARRVREAGGILVVQDPATAEMPTMPSAAIALGRPQAIGTVDEIAILLSAGARARTT